MAGIFSNGLHGKIIGIGAVDLMEEPKQTAWWEDQGSQAMDWGEGQEQRAIPAIPSSKQPDGDIKFALKPQPTSFEMAKKFALPAAPAKYELPSWFTARNALIGAGVAVAAIVAFKMMKGR